jgi:hypothetical protein
VEENLVKSVEMLDVFLVGHFVNQLLQQTLLEVSNC